ncbi:MAG: DUF4139 domain-containing protein [Candidatus Omnitrophica bacterium]|nr:DUF4139 domain-containing protein [Candidatus Omnitrophota bacterium]MDD5430469.1 DUF4139 domain-containing protein [Candidatus Omnitrophota bacterium]
MKYVLVFFLLCITSFSVIAAEKEEVELTIYNQNFALVKDKRFFNFGRGINVLSFRDVASQIEPTSVHFSSLTAPGACTILEQNYEYDLVSSKKLLSKYIDNRISVLLEDGRIYEGDLLSQDDSTLILKTSEGLRMISWQDNIRQILFEKLPKDLITKPTLVWSIDSQKKGRHLAEVSYLTKGISWNCEYVVVLDKDDENIDLDGWVSINNQSGASYEDAGLKLIAGDVKRAQEQVEYRRKGMMQDFVMKTASAPQFQEKTFFEYHMYALGRKTTLKDNQTKQVSLLNAFSVPTKKELIFDLSRVRTYRSDTETIEGKVRVELVLQNSKDNNLGMPLPQGKVKVYKKDHDQSLQFIGEDAIKHTPKDEEIRLHIGDAFDVTGKRTRKSYRRENKTARESFEIELKNHKDKVVTVKVNEKMWRYANWQILESSDKWKKIDASTIEFNVNLKKDQEKKLTYTVKYWW